MSDRKYTYEELVTESQVLVLALAAVQDLWRAGVLTLQERDALNVRMHAVIDRVRAAQTKAAEEELAQGLFDRPDDLII